MNYEFTLIYRLSAEDSDFDSLVERLAEAGCTDALVGTGLPGRLGLEFSREAASAKNAVLSAIADVKNAIPTAELIEATPDLVGLSDAAEVVGVSRQNLRKLMLSHSHDFPSPVHAGSTTVWHLEDLVVWLVASKSYKVEPVTLEIAKTTKQINLAKEAKAIQPQFQKEFMGVFA
jgi:predicted DNA-binding transcriptional regulator AlpA